jgi:hypothetical protein
MLSGCEIFRFAPNFDARARSAAFSHRRIQTARMSRISRLWVMLLDQDREHQNRKNHGTQNSHCKPLSIAIKSSDHVICGG